MGIFNKEQEVDLEEFCSDFYEKNILHPVIKGIDAGVVFVDTIKRNVVEADNNFAKINQKKFADEIILLRFELFALAWLHQFGEKSAVAQSIFTKNYLHGKNRDDIWGAMEPYNQAIARSSTLGRTSKNAFDRVYLTRVMKTRADLADKYINDAKKSGIDLDDKTSIPILESIGRPLNRLFTDDVWKKGVTAGLLMFAICDRFGFESNFEPTKEAQFRLTAIIRGFYDGAKQALEKVKIKQK